MGGNKDYIWATSVHKHLFTGQHRNVVYSFSQSIVFKAFLLLLIIYLPHILSRDAMKQEPRSKTKSKVDEGTSFLQLRNEK